METPLIGNSPQDGLSDTANTLGMNNWNVVPFGKLVFVLNAKLYLDNAPAVGASAEDTKVELSSLMSSAIPIVLNMRFSSNMNSFLIVRTMKLDVPPLSGGLSTLSILSVLATLRMASVK